MFYYKNNLLKKPISKEDKTHIKRPAKRLVKCSRIHCKNGRHKELKKLMCLSITKHL